VFANNQDGKEHVALVRNHVFGAHDVPTRLHSECLTGDVLASLRCDCRQQLERALGRVFPEVLAREQLGLRLVRQVGHGQDVAGEERVEHVREYEPGLGVQPVDDSGAIQERHGRAAARAAGAGVFPGPRPPVYA